MSFQVLTGRTEGGLAANQDTDFQPVILAAPAIDDGKNVFRDSLIPQACWRLDDIRFGFDSSFLQPESAAEFKLLRVLLQQHAGAPLSVFGHSDPTGKDDYNKVLSGRRAAVVYGVLTRTVELWEGIYTDPQGGDDWGVRSVQIMLDALGYAPGPIDGVKGPQTSGAIQRFQSDNGLATDGVLGPNTRAKLFAAYMELLCVDKDGQPWKLEKTDFLAKGAGQNGKGDYQGCSEFNPDVMISSAENTEYRSAEKKAVRDEVNAPNRRVVIFLFRPGSKVIPAKWPCPAAKDGVAGCKKRFWSDWATRRSFQDERREFESTRDTYACRFYHRIAGSSPCERLGDTYLLRLFDEDTVPIGYARYEVEVDQARRRGQADPDGWIRLREVELPHPCTIRWSRPDSDAGSEEAPKWDYYMQVEIDIGEKEETAHMQRLHNLGYPFGETLKQRLGDFQKDYGELADLLEVVDTWHQDADPDKRPPRKDQGA